MTQPFPQSSSLSAALLERQLELLGSLLAVVEEANQVQILDVMLAASKGPPTRPGLKELPLWRHAILTTICSAALAGLDSLARRFRGIHTVLLIPEYKLYTFKMLSWEENILQNLDENSFVKIV